MVIAKYFSFLHLRNIDLYRLVLFLNLVESLAHNRSLILIFVDLN